MIDGDRVGGGWTQAVHDYLTGSISSRFRGQEATVTDQWKGRDNLLWRVRCADGSDVVLKMFTDAGQARCRRQFSGQDQFAGAGLAPAPLWYDRYPHGLPCQILVYRWTEGEPLSLAPNRMKCNDSDRIRLTCLHSGRYGRRERSLCESGCQLLQRRC